MGMFDYVKIDQSIKLPVSKEFRSLKIDPHSLEFQTKSLDNCLISYEIKKDKRLYENNKKNTYHGMIYFGACHITDTVTYSLEYQAKFTDGLLKNIKLLEYKSFQHESRSLQHQKLLENVKKNNKRPITNILRFFEKTLVLYPLNFFGFNFTQGSLGVLTSENFNIVFYCPKVVLGYKKDYNDKFYGLSLDQIATEFVFHKRQYTSSFSFRVLGFGFLILNYGNLGM
jgi:hypothetical protein